MFVGLPVALLRPRTTVTLSFCLCRGAKEILGLSVYLERLAWLDPLGQLDHQDPQDPQDPRDHQDQDLPLDL